MLGIGTRFEIEIGDRIRVFTTGGVGPEPFEGVLSAIEENAIVLNGEILDGEGKPVDSRFIRYCCSHITTIELRRAASD